MNSMQTTEKRKKWFEDMINQNCIIFNINLGRNDRRNLIQCAKRFGIMFGSKRNALIISYQQIMALYSLLSDGKIRGPKLKNIIVSLKEVTE